MDSPQEENKTEEASGEQTAGGRKKNVAALADSLGDAIPMQKPGAPGTGGGRGRERGKITALQQTLASTDGGAAVARAGGGAPPGGGTWPQHALMHGSVRSRSSTLVTCPIAISHKQAEEAR